MRLEHHEFNKACNDIADHLIATSEYRSSARIRRFQEDVRQVLGDSVSDPILLGSDLGIRFAATFFDGIDNFMLYTFILGAKISGGRKTETT